jgi:hypothetical protein
MTTRPEPNHLVMLNLFQHLVFLFLPSADALLMNLSAASSGVSKTKIRRSIRRKRRGIYPKRK